LNPSYAEAYNNLGTVLRLHGAREKALAAHRQAISLKPQMVDAYNNIAQLLEDSGDTAGAVQAYQTSLQHSLAQPETQQNLARILAASGKTELAFKHISAALELTPDNAKCLDISGALLFELGRLDEARRQLAKALEINPEINPELAQAWYNLGVIDQITNQTDAACQNFERAIKFAPNFVKAISNLGVLQSTKGEISRARVLYKQALEIDPYAGDIHYNLAEASKYTKGDAHLVQLKTLLSDPDLPPDQIAAVKFALGKALIDISEPDLAFRHISAANQMYKRAHPYNIETDRRVFAAIKSAAIDYAPIVGTQSPRQIPIFIVGMPRSGTSLVEQILASHSDVFGAGELNALRQSLAPVLIPGDTPTMACNSAQGLRQDYLADISTLHVQQKFISDKMPLNFRWVGFALAAMPEARILHIKRDPVATCWSIFQRRFAITGAGNAYAYSLKDVAEYYKLYQSLMQFWTDRHPNLILDISYESLTENQAVETKRMLDYCGLAWQAQCLDFHKNTRDVKTASSLQVRQKMYRDSSKAWRVFEPHLKPLIDILNASDG
ncbi:MAG: tetratricopeptide repeat protein, partial [Alphaproteobacteria bacterium]|nr:tetratricopeptide repeat protein [Alphaproteobacteria bacterium]